MPRLLPLVGSAVFLMWPAAAPAQGIDPARAKADPAGKLLWYDARLLGLEGKGWADTKSYYDRFPGKAEGVVREAVWSLSRHAAGLCVRFTTDATAVHARWTLTGSNLAMPHMPATGVSGVDLYVQAPDGGWRWLSTGRPTQVTNTAALAANLPAGKRTFLLYLPLYNGVSSVEIGLPQGSTLARASLPPERKLIVFYGTSITQGGCASRPGMVHTAIVGRRLDYPVINLGFSGNGRMEAEVARLLGEIDASVYVIDCLPNMGAKDVGARTEPLVRILREARPKTPVLLVEDRTYANAFLNPGMQQRHAESRKELRQAYERLTQAGVKALYYLKGETLLGDDGEDTVDGSHPTDLGFLRQAAAFQTALEPILRGTK